jgi:hypothetical protein
MTIKRFTTIAIAGVSTLTMLSTAAPRTRAQQSGAAA